MKPSNGRFDSPAGPGAIACTPGGMEGGSDADLAGRVLLVAASVASAKPLMQRLRDAGWDVVRYRTVREGIRVLASPAAGPALFDIIVWDQTRGAPADAPGRCRALAAVSRRPLLVLSSPQHTADDRVNLLNGGADSVLRMPAAWPEVLAELRVLTRRRPAPARDRPEPEDWVRVGPLELSLARREMRLDGGRVALTLREFDLLHYLAVNHDRAVTRPMALDAVWGYDAPASPAAVDVYIGYLRRKLLPAAGRIAIHTVRGVGYTLTAHLPHAGSR